MRLRRTLALFGAVSAAVFAACEAPPFAPRWDADFYMPLSTETIHLDQLLSPLTAIPPAQPAPDSFPVQTQDVSGVLGDILKNLVTDATRCTAPSDPGKSCDLLALTITKRTAVSVNDTLFVANSPAGLNASTAGTVVFPISLAVGDVTNTDTLYLTPASVAMLQQAGQDEAPLYILLRGRVSNPSANSVPLTSADSLGITLSVTARVAVSHK